MKNNVSEVTHHRAKCTGKEVVVLGRRWMYWGGDGCTGNEVAVLGRRKLHNVSPYPGQCQSVDDCRVWKAGCLHTDGR